VETRVGLCTVGTGRFSTAKPRHVVFVGSPEKYQLIRENDTARSNRSRFRCTNYMSYRLRSALQLVRIHSTGSPALLLSNGQDTFALYCVLDVYGPYINWHWPANVISLWLPIGRGSGKSLRVRYHIGFLLDESRGSPSEPGTPPYVVNVTQNRILASRPN
jgi:hypothetical protein